MSKKIIIFILVIIILAGAGYFIYQSNMGSQYKIAPEKSVAVDAKNATYIIEGESVALVNGKSEKDIEDSASKIITQYFGNEVKADFNGDGKDDAAFILTQDGGGSGTFFYIAVALSDGNGVVGTNAIFLGDRIAPQTTEFKNEEIIANYADRKPSDPMTTKPSVGVSRYFKIISEKLTEIQK